MEQIKKLFDLEIANGYSVTSKHFSLSPIFQTLDKKSIHTNLYKRIQENSINELLVNKTYDSKTHSLSLSMIEMNNTTDELLFLTLIGLNRTYIEITLKELAQLMHFGKESGKERTKDRIMDSVNKLLKCSININFKDTNEHYGFHILKYKYNQRSDEQQKTLKIWFDLDFINLYKSSNNSIIDTKLHKALKSDYSKGLYSLINNFSTQDNQFEFNKKVLHEKFGCEKLTKNQKERIKKGLNELKEHGIIHSFTLLKNDNLKIKKAHKKFNVIDIATKEEKKMQTVKSNINLTATQKKNDIIEMPENTKKEIETKFKFAEIMANDAYNGLEISEHVEINNVYKRLKEMVNIEEKVVNEVIEVVNNEEDLFSDIIIKEPAKGRESNKTKIISK